jgi:hypothetical protein
MEKNSDIKTIEFNVGIEVSFSTLLELIHKETKGKVQVMADEPFVTDPITTEIVKEFFKKPREPLIFLGMNLMNSFKRSNARMNQNPICALSIQWQKQNLLNSKNKHRSRLSRGSSRLKSLVSRLAYGSIIGSCMTSRLSRLSGQKETISDSITNEIHQR